jgi:hypothetical protein
MSQTIAAPTKVEVDAAERVLAEAHGCNPDGFWRETAVAVLEAASEAQLRDFIRVVDVELKKATEHYSGVLDAVLAGASMDRLEGALVSHAEDGRVSPECLEAATERRPDFDRALGEGRR